MNIENLRELIINCPVENQGLSAGYLSKIHNLGTIDQPVVINDKSLVDVLIGLKAVLYEKGWGPELNLFFSKNIESCMSEVFPEYRFGEKIFPNIDISMRDMPWVFNKKGQCVEQMLCCYLSKEYDEKPSVFIDKPLIPLNTAASIAWVTRDSG